MPTTGDLDHNPGMCPVWESNVQPFGSQNSAQSTEPHQPGPASPLTGPTTDLRLTLTHSLWALALDQKLEGHQWHDKNMKFWPQSKCQGTASFQTKLQRPGISHCPFSQPSPTQSHRAAAPYLRLHQPGSHRLFCTGDYLRLSFI